MRTSSASASGTRASLTGFSVEADRRRSARTVSTAEPVTRRVVRRCAGARIAAGSRPASLHSSTAASACWPSVALRPGPGCWRHRPGCGGIGERGDPPGRHVAARQRQQDRCRCGSAGTSRLARRRPVRTNTAAATNGLGKRRGPRLSSGSAAIVSDRLERRLRCGRSARAQQPGRMLHGEQRRARFWLGGNVHHGVSHCHLRPDLLCSVLPTTGGRAVHRPATLI